MLESADADENVRGRVEVERTAIKALGRKNIPRMAMVFMAELSAFAALAMAAELPTRVMLVLASF